MYIIYGDTWLHSGRRSRIDSRRTHSALHKNASVNLGNHQGERVEQSRIFLVRCMYLVELIIHIIIRPAYKTQQRKDYTYKTVQFRITRTNTIHYFL